MPFPILIPLAIAAAGVGVGGANIASGTSKNNHAKRLNDDIQLSLGNAQDKAERARKKTNQCLTNLGQIKCEVLNTTVKRFLSTFNEIHNVELNGILLSDEPNQYTVDYQTLCDMKQFSTMASSVLSGIVGGAGTGALAAFGAYSATALLGTASTGTPIVALSGIAAQNATLAFLGGGTLAAGGGGIAAGIAGLSGVAAGVGVAVLGIVVNISASKNLNNAYSNLAQAEEAVVGMETIAMLCQAISQKADMFSELLYNLDQLLIKCLDDLDGIIDSSGSDYNYYLDEEKAVVAMTLSVIGAIKTILDTPILDNDGNITNESETVYSEVDTHYSQLSGSPRKSHSSGKVKPSNSTHEIINLIETFLYTKPGDALFRDKSNRGRKFEVSVCFNLSSFNASIDSIVGLYDPSPMNCLTGDVSGILFCIDRFIFKQRPKDIPASFKYSEIKNIKQTFNYLHVYSKNGNAISMKSVSYSNDDVYMLFKRIVESKSK